MADRAIKNLLFVLLAAMAMAMALVPVLAYADDPTPE